VLLKHFNRKIPCQPIKEDIELPILEEQFRLRSKRSKNADTGLFECSNCGKEYKSSNGKYKHMKNCSKTTTTEESNQEADLLSQALKRIGELEKRVVELGNSLAEMKEEVKTLSPISIVFLFGKENLINLTEDELV
jgi:hypothetical protein